MSSLQEKYGKLQQGQTFASLKFADDFMSTGALPKIHEDIGVVMGRIPQDRRKGALDLGACHGLLSVRAARMGWSPVRGVEADPRSVDVFTQHIKGREGRADITLNAASLTVREPTSLKNMVDEIKLWGVNTVLARRILPELFVDTYGKAGLDPMVHNDAGHKFGRALLDAGVEFLIVEGRLWRQYKQHANPLYKVENEIEALGPGWRITHRHKEVVLLEPA